MNELNVFPLSSFLYSTYLNKSLFSSSVFQQTLISSGTEPALKLILNTLKDESLPTSEGTVQRLFAQLAVTIKTPTLLPQVLVSVAGPTEPVDTSRAVW